MSIQKKSLISTLKTAKKANVVSQSEDRGAKPTNVVSKRQVSMKKQIELRKQVNLRKQVSTRKAIN